jgi:hypothetical protein
MKKSYLAAAAILGAAVFAGQAHAVKIDLGKTKFKMGFRAKVHAVYLGKRNSEDKSDLIFSVPFTRIYAKGSISKIFKWGWQMEFGRYKASPEFIDSFVMLDFAKEFRIMAGAFKLPFELHSGIQSGWSFLMPLGPSYGLADNPFKNPARTTIARSGSRSPQVGVWGKVAGGMLKYYAMLVDGQDKTSANKADTGVALRVEFAPTMMGYSGHPGYVLKETYLGKKNILTVGVSYFTQKMKSGETARSWSIDALWEQNMGGIVPNISIGYVNHKNWKGTKDDDRQGFIVQGQVLFNQKTILGKPAIAIRWAQSDPDDIGSTKRYKSSVFGVTGQLYVKGVGNRIALSVESVNFKDPSKKDYTDVALALWFNF